MPHIHRHSASERIAVNFLEENQSAWTSSYKSSTELSCVCISVLPPTIEWFACDHAGNGMQANQKRKTPLREGSTNPPREEMPIVPGRFIAYNYSQHAQRISIMDHPVRALPAILRDDDSSRHNRNAAARLPRRPAACPGFEQPFHPVWNQHPLRTDQPRRRAFAERCQRHPARPQRISVGRHR